MCMKHTILAALLLTSVAANADTIVINRMGGEIEVADAPHGAVLRTMGGNIHVTRGSGKVVAKTMGGDIDIAQLEGSAEAGTMGGDIRVNVVGSGGGHDLDLHSMGGDIEVSLPHDFDGEFNIELEESTDEDSPGHSITSDFPLQLRQSTRWSLFGGRRKVFSATGRSGSAANRVSISTIGSNIRIRRK